MCKQYNDLDNFFNLKLDFNDKNCLINHNISVSENYYKTCEDDKNFFLNKTEIFTTKESGSDSMDYFTYNLANKHFKKKVKNLTEILSERVFLSEKQKKLEDNHETLIKSLHSSSHTLPASIVFFSHYVDYIVSSETSKKLKIKDLGVHTLNYFNSDECKSLITVPNIKECIDDAVLHLSLQNFTLESRRPQFKEYCNILRLRTIFLFFKFLNTSFGLTLGHSIASTFRSLSFNSSKSSELSHIFQKIQTYDNIASIKGELKEIIYSFEFKLKKTDFRQKVCNYFFQIIRASISLVFNNEVDFISLRKELSIFKIQIQNEINVYYNFSEIQVAEITSILDLFLIDESACRTILNTNLDSFINDSTEYTGDFILNLIELSNLFVLETEQLFKSQLIKTVGLITIKKSFIADFIKISYCIDKYPMIQEPEDWIEVNNSKTGKSLNFGGFSINKNDILPGIHVFTETYTSHNLVLASKAANYLQKQPFKVNEKFLFEILNQFPFFLKKFLNLTELEENCLFLPGKNLTLVSELDFLNAVCGGYVEPSDTKMQSQNDFKRNYYQVFYKIKVTQIFDFINYLSVFFFFRNFILWTPYILDFRLRAYPTGIISTQGSNFVKSLLELLPVFNDQKNALLSNKDDLISSINLQIEAWKKDCAKSPNKIFSAFKAENNFFWTTISLDASASGIQILSGLLGYIDGLVLTNFIVKKDCSLDKKQDAYTIFGDCYIEILKAYVSSNSYYEQTDCIEVRAFKESLIYDIIHALDRKVMKSFLMCYFYSEGTFSRSNKLKEVVIFSEKTMKLKGKVEVLRMSTSAIINHLEMKICGPLFTEAVEKKFYPIFNLKTKLEALVNNNQIINQKGIQLCISEDSNYANIFYLVSKTESKRTSYYSSYEKKRVGYVLSIANGVFDKRAAKSKIVPNLIHRLDSEILIRVVVRCQQESIPLYTAHDCFSTYPYYASQVKKIYFDSFCDVFFKNDVLYNFIKSNSTKEEFTLFEPFLIENMSNLKNCYSEIQKNYIMSNNILTS